jgi:Ethanolamine utilization protein EutJ (predicted chaperonin)
MLRLHVRGLAVTSVTMQHAKQSIKPCPYRTGCKAATAVQNSAGIAEVEHIHGESLAASASALLVHAKDDKAVTWLGGTPGM